MDNFFKWGAEGRALPSRLLASASVGIVLASGCGLVGVTHRIADETPEELEYLASVSEVAWKWQAPDGEYRPNVRAVPGGVAVFHGDGVRILAGDSGERIWEYRDRGRMVLGNVSDNGEWVVLHVADDYEDEQAQMVVLDSATGELHHEYEADTSDRIVGGGESAMSLRPALRAVAEETWFTADPEGPLRARELGSDQELWQVAEPFECDGIGSTEAVLAWEESVLMGYTCYQAPEDPEEQEEAAFSENTEFVSGLVGFDPVDGTELWREQESTGKFPEDSLIRTFDVLEGDTLLVRYSHEHLGQVVDPHSGIVVTTEEGQVPVWATHDGERIGVWDRGARGYGMVDSQGRMVEEAYDRSGTVSVPGAVEPPVGLEEGVVHFDGQGRGGTEFAVFDDGQNLVPFSVDDALARSSSPKAVSVPGAVAVTYIDSEGDRYVVGLR